MDSPVEIAVVIGELQQHGVGFEPAQVITISSLCSPTDIIHLDCPSTSKGDADGERS